MRKTKTNNIKIPDNSKLVFDPEPWYCKTCEKILVSSYPGEFVSCKCGNFVDQTEHYMRRGGSIDNLIPYKDRNK